MAIELDDISHYSARVKNLRVQAFDPQKYETDFSWKQNLSPTPWNARTVFEMLECLYQDETVEIDAEILTFRQNEKGEIKPTPVRITGRQKFLETWTQCEEIFNRRNFSFYRMREAVDYFATDSSPALQGTIGRESLPLLGGPFFKQLYLNDYQKQQAQAFYAYHFDPIAKQAVDIIVNFTLGREWKVKFKDETHQAAWDAFAEANKLPEQMKLSAREISVYGETMWRLLPDQDIYWSFDINSPQGVIPRIRVFDPSMVWDYATFPEDIERVLFYQIVSPTQYQIYTSDNKTGQQVPSAKFLFQQLPADKVIHKKVNVLSNEKRGRSDLSASFDYLKRLRDTINFSIASLQKNAAWSIDTTIEGSQEDIDAYAESQAALGTIPPAGSEFIHTPKVKREYLSNNAGKGGGMSDAFQWVLSMVASGLGIPISYFGTHLSGGQTRASAIVATEPVAKKFEERRQVYADLLEEIKRRVFPLMGLPRDAEMEVIFPDLYTVDRSGKLKDLAVAEQSGWISKETAATIAAKEMGLEKYDYTEEKAKIDAEKPQQDQWGMDPLSSPGLSDWGQDFKRASGQLDSKTKDEMKDAGAYVRA